MRTRPLTTTEAAARLGRSRETARRLAASGALDAEKAGRDWLIEESSVAAQERPDEEPRP
jgi:excisionase family DNA binding protein